MRNNKINKLNDVLVFKTSIDNNLFANIILEDMKIINPNALCNFDLDDCDKIFRVENSKINASQIEKYFRQIGYECLELE